MTQCKYLARCLRIKGSVHDVQVDTHRRPHCSSSGHIFHQSPTAALL